ncbi:ATP/GTP-binding protein, partial [Ruminococcaceae bacterium OttesenSCG-928-A16]|nr:ATP/GTP-binding protein [Ruminococcaceae bacterium OttesenSCG-928-A16]
LETNEIAYVVQHLNGSSCTALEDYSYHLPVSVVDDTKSVHEYDIMKLNTVEIEEHPRYLVYEQDGRPVYSTYLTISEITDELDFPGSEVFYSQPVSFDFPVDTSIKVKVLKNREALKKVRGQKARLGDMDKHAAQTGNNVDGDVDIAMDDIDVLETTVKVNRESMYIVSYVVRVAAFDRKELTRRVNAVTDFYSGYSINVVRPSGDMMVLHDEFMPSARLKKPNCSVFPQ